MRLFGISAPDLPLSYLYFSFAGDYFCIRQKAGAVDFSADHGACFNASPLRQQTMMAFVVSILDGKIMLGNPALFAGIFRCARSGFRFETHLAFCLPPDELTTPEQELLRSAYDRADQIWRQALYSCDKSTAADWQPIWNQISASFHEVEGVSRILLFSMWPQ